MTHKYRLLVTIENYERGGCDFYFWCENCGIVKMKPGKEEEEILFYIPKGQGSKPNSTQCIDS